MLIYVTWQEFDQIRKLAMKHMDYMNNPFDLDAVKEFCRILNDNELMLPVTLNDILYKTCELKAVYKEDLKVRMVKDGAEISLGE